MPLGLAKQTSIVSDPLESVNRPAKMIKLDDGRNSSYPGANLNVSNANGAAASQVFGTGSLPGKTVPKPEEVHSEKQISQVMFSHEYLSSKLSLDILTLSF